MQKSRNKIIAILTALLMLAPIASIAFTSAHTPAWPIPTTAFIAIAPNPCGVNQTVVVSFWLDKATPTTNGVFGDRWSNFSAVNNNA